MLEQILKLTSLLQLINYTTGAPVNVHLSMDGSSRTLLLTVKGTAATEKLFTKDYLKVIDLTDAMARQKMATEYYVINSMFLKTAQA